MKKTLYGGIGMLAAGLGVTLVLMAGSGPSASAAASPLQTSVTVYGSSSSMVTPNQAQVMVGVDNQAASSQSALSANNRITNQVVFAIEKLGIPKTAVSTSGLNINPNYNQANPPSVTGYQVSDNLTINATVGLAGKVIDRAVAAGANQVNGINFTTSGSSSYQKTYRAALDNARAQASAVAAGLGEHIQGITSVQIQSPGTTGPQQFFNAGVATASTAVYPGQQQETVTLKVVYHLTP